MGREPVGERTLTRFDGMNKSTWQPATHPVGSYTVLPRDSEETVPYRKGAIGWWMGNNAETLKVPRHGVQPRTSVIFPSQTGSMYKRTDVNRWNEIKDWKLALPLATEVYIKRKNPIDALNFCVDQVAEIAISPNRFKVEKTVAKVSEEPVHIVKNLLVSSQLYLVPGTKIWCQAAMKEDAAGDLEIVTLLFTFEHLTDQPATIKRDDDDNVSPIVFLGTLIDTYNLGDSHCRVALSPVAYGTEEVDDEY